MSKLKHIEVQANTIKVLTPIPYRVVRKYDHETEDDVKDKEYRLNAACKFLYDCMRLLGISRKEAAQQEFTLNTATGDKIINIAAHKNISHEMYMTIKNYNW